MPIIRVLLSGLMLLFGMVLNGIDFDLKESFFKIEPNISNGKKKTFGKLPLKQKLADANLKFGKIFLVEEGNNDRIELKDYQKKISGPDIGKFLCFKENEPWSWEAIDQSIKNLQASRLIKTAHINILPEQGETNNCPLEVVLQQKCDRQYKLKLGSEFFKNSYDKFLSLDCSLYNYKIKNSIFSIGLDLSDRSNKFKTQLDLPVMVFIPIELLFFFNANFDRPDRKMLLNRDLWTNENCCEDCLKIKVAETSLLSSTKLGVSVEPRLLIFGHTILYNLMIDRQAFDVNPDVERRIVQQVVFCKQNLDNLWACRNGTNFCFKCTLVASARQVCSEFSLNQSFFIKLNSSSSFVLLFDCNFGTRNNFFHSLQQLCKIPVDILHNRLQLINKMDTNCDLCLAQRFKNIFPPVTDRISHDYLIPQSSVVFNDGLVHTNLMLQVRKKISQSFSMLGFHNFFYTQGGDFYNSSGVGVRYNSSIGTFCLDFAFKWDAKVAMEKKLAWRLTFGESF